MLVQIFASSACDRRGLDDLGAEHLEQLGGPGARALADAADDAGQRRDLLEEVVLGDPLRHVRDEQVLADPEAAPLLDVAGHPLGGARARRWSAGSATGPRAAPAAGRRSRRGSATCRSRCARSAGVPSVSTMWSARAASWHGARCARGGRRAARARAAPGAGLVERHPARRRPARAPPARARRRSRRGRGRRRRARAAGRRGRGRRPRRFRHAGQSTRSRRRARPGTGARTTSTKRGLV